MAQSISRIGRGRVLSSLDDPRSQAEVLGLERGDDAGRAAMPVGADIGRLEQPPGTAVGEDLLLVADPRGRSRGTY
jgi:hypothetical protein